MTDDVNVIKAVRTALGPDAKCDPYPNKEFNDGAALFTKKYADQFYYDHPEFSHIPFSVLKKTNHKHPIIQQVVREYSEENRKYADLVNQWRDKWPEYAERVDVSRQKSSSQRRDRKKRQRIAGPTACRSGGGLPWLTQEWFDTMVAVGKRYDDTALKLLHAAAEIREACEEHRAFIQVLEQDREDVF